MTERNRNHRAPRKGRGKPRSSKADRQASGRAGRAPKAGKEDSQAQALWYFGSHAVQAALANPDRRCRRLLITGEVWQRNRESLRPLLERRPDLPVETAERSELENLVPESSVHQGIALKVEPLGAITLDSFLSGSGRTSAQATEAPEEEREGRNGEIVVVLDQVEDPRNLGAILRSAAAFKVGALVLQERHSPPESAALAKTASGALERVPLIRVPNLTRALERLKEAGYWSLGLDQEGDAPLSGFVPGHKTALVLGAEGRGLRRLTRQACDFLCRLPTDPAFPVLNVSNAAAIALYELRRRP